MIDLQHVGRLGLIGDVHAEDALLERAIEELGARGAEPYLCEPHGVCGARHA